MMTLTTTEPAGRTICLQLWMNTFPCAGVPTGYTKRKKTYYTTKHGIAPVLPFPRSREREEQMLTLRVANRLDIR